MKKNRGKKFEAKIKQSLEKVENCAVQRLNDNVKYRNAKNPSDFLAYKKPYLYYIECKSTTGASLPYAKITQWDMLLKKSKIDGVFAGVIIWFIDKDLTFWIDIRELENLKKETKRKSINYEFAMTNPNRVRIIDGIKRKIYYDYNMTDFLESFER